MTFSSELNDSEISLESTSRNFQNIPMQNDNILEKWIVILLESDVCERQGVTGRLIERYCDVPCHVEVFSCVDNCVDFLTNLSNEKVCLILWQSVVNNLLPLIHNCAQLESIYALSDTESDNKSLKNTYKKFEGSFSSMVDIFYHFKETIRRSKNDSISISILPPSTVASANELDSSFMYTQLLKDIILRKQYGPNSKSDFIDHLRTEYAGDSIGLKSVNYFDQNYSNKSPIWWYSKERFVFEPLNRALRTQQAEILVRMGFYIQDLHREIERLHQEQRSSENLCLYRGQAMGNNDFVKLKSNRGGLLSFNNFLSTSADKDVSRLLAESSASQSNSVGILFQIEIDPTISTTPFASVEQVSHFSDEKEFLFCMHTICRIGEVKNIQDAVWQVDLTLTDDNDEQLKQITEWIRREIQNGSIDKSLGHLLYCMGEYNSAKTIFEKMLTSTCANDVHSRLYLYNLLGRIAYSTSNFLSALAYFQQILDLCPLPVDCNSFNLVDTYINIAAVHHSMGNYSEAIEFHKLATDIREGSLSYSSPNLGLIYNNIALTYISMGRHSDAREYFQKSLNHLELTLPSGHPDLSKIYSNIGLINFILGERENALEYHKKALEIQRKSLPPFHINIVGTLNNVAVGYQWMGQYRTAIDYFQEALKVMKGTSLCEHADFAIIYNNIGQLYKVCSEYDKALPYLLKAIEIQKAVVLHGEPKLAVFYVNTALLYRLMGDFSVAIEYLETAHKIQKECLPANHPEFARTYNGFGIVYQARKEFWMALDYFQRAIDAQKTLSATHPDRASIYNNIADVELHLGHESNAVEYIEETLKIQKDHLEPAHPEIGRTYLNMAIIYMRMKNYSKAQECFTETYRIFKTANLSKHHYFGMFYTNLGVFNCVMENLSTALKHFEKAREIFEEVLPPNHPDLIRIHGYITKVHRQMSSFTPISWHF